MYVAESLNTLSYALWWSHYSPNDLRLLTGDPLASPNFIQENKLEVIITERAGWVEVIERAGWVEVIDDLSVGVFGLINVC